MMMRFTQQIFVWNTFLLTLNLSPIHSQIHTFQKKITKVRLSGGSFPYEGNVQVATDQDGKYLTLCDDFFGMSEANSVCAELGFGKAIRFTRNNHFGENASRRPTEADAWRFMYSLDCPNDNNNTINIQDCTVMDNEEDMCTSNEVAGVVCQSDAFVTNCSLNEFVCEDVNSSSCIEESLVCDAFPDCSDESDEKSELCNDDGVVRLQSNMLTNIPGETTLGTVYIKHNGIWSTVCDDGFDKKDAQVICRSLGYDGGMSAPFSKGYFGKGTGHIYVDETNCLGHERSLTQCPGFIWGDTDCRHHEDAGVFCQTGNLDVQLVGGSTKDSGRVEMTSSVLTTPTAICDKGFDDFDAQVVCRMLGYDGTDAVAHKGSPFGGGSGIIWHVILDCLGNEMNIQDCRIRITNETCTHRDTAAVTCIRERSVEELLSGVLPTECGEPVDASNQFITGLGKVRGGVIPSRFDAPWLAALRLRKPAGYIYDCAATIISEYYLVTVAHCFETQGKLHFIVSVGDYNSHYRESTQQDFFIDKLWIHEDYQEVSEIDNDIALIKVEEKNGRGIRLGPRVKAACLPKIGDTYDDLTSCSVAGWGRTDVFGDGTTLPRVAEINVLLDRLCEETYSSLTYTSSNTCFGDTENFVNPCQGDSGGPVTCKIQGRHILYAFVSSGEACGSRSFPDVYTRVTKYLRWIQEIITQDRF